MSDITSYYYTVQWRRIQRWFSEIGVSSVIGIPLLLIAVAVSIAYVNSKTMYAPYILLIAYGAIVHWAITRQVDPFSSVIPRKKILLIKTGIAIACMIPFVINYVYTQQYLYILALPFIALALSMVRVQHTSVWDIWTPFKKIPFESIIFFRRFVLFFPIAGYVLFQAIQVENYNLAAACIFFLSMFYISVIALTEEEYYVWIYNKTPNAFLLHKLKHLTVSYYALCAPFLVFTIYFFMSTWHMSVILTIVLWLYLTLILFLKYTVFPKTINVLEVLILSACVLIPPLLLLAVPWSFRKATRTLALSVL